MSTPLHLSLPPLSPSLPSNIGPAQDHCSTDSSPDTHLQGTILLIWSNLSLIITAVIHRPGHTLLSHHRSVLTPSLAPLGGLPFLAPAGLLSGNQAGRAHSSAHIILPIITNEYELPSVGHTRRESGREGRGGGVQECHSVVLTYKQAHALLIYMSRVTLTHIHTHTHTHTHARTHICSSNKVTTGTCSPAGSFGVWKEKYLKLNLSALHCFSCLEAGTV